MEKNTRTAADTAAINNAAPMKDRIGEYLIPRIQDEFLFDELSPGFLERAGIADILTDVPVPIRKSDLSQGMTTVNIARNMAYIIGCDINFRYRDAYIAYIDRMFQGQFVRPLLGEGTDLASHDDYESAAILFRAAILIDPDNGDAYYCYGRACRDAYENGEGEEYVGKFKAESLEAFEKLTMKSPDFDMGYYFLGFGYINLGLYIKAKLTWDRFMELSKEGELRAEIRGYLDKLEEPCRIEKGYNSVLAGRYSEGLAILEPYKEDERFNQWWPLWYYIGVAYKGLEDANSAEESLLQGLRYAPSSVDIMKELVEIYDAFGDREKRDKYAKKIEIVKKNAELDREERKAAQMPGLS